LCAGDTLQDRDDSGDEDSDTGEDQDSGEGGHVFYGSKRLSRHEYSLKMYSSDVQVDSAL